LVLVAKHSTPDERGKQLTASSTSKTAMNSKAEGEEEGGNAAHARCLVLAAQHGTSD
jgi:hypothetical protein